MNGYSDHHNGAVLTALDVPLGVEAFESASASGTSGEA